MNRSSNDQRSDSKNPTSQEYKDTQDNKSNQGNPNNPAYDSSRAGAQEQQQGQGGDQSK